MKQRLPRKKKKQLKKDLEDKYFFNIIKRYCVYVSKGGHLSFAKFDKRCITKQYKRELEKLELIEKMMNKIHKLKEGLKNG